MTIILVYIDGMLIAGDNLNLIEETKDALQKAFNWMTWEGSGNILPLNYLGSRKEY